MLESEPNRQPDDHSVGADPMHPDPQDESAEPTSEDDGTGTNRTDDESSVERYRNSPGLAATRPMSEPGDKPEPNEPG